MALEDYAEDIETCFGTSCAFCERGCPVYRVLNKKTFTSRGRNRTILGILKGKIKPSQELADAYYQCTLCGNCERWCALPDTEITKALREYLVENGFVNEAHKRLVENVEKVGNPYGEPASKRYEWQSWFDFSREAETLFFGGCTMPLRQSEILKKGLELLGPSNLQVMTDDGEILEPCCGSVLNRTGHTSEGKKLAESIVKYIQEHDIHEIVTACPGCLTTLQDIIEEYNLHTELTHLVEKLAEEVQSGKIKIKHSGKKITYHDPCHLGRLHGVFDPPREIISAVGELIELPHNRYESFCCGAGGGVRAGYSELSKKIGTIRMEEIKVSGAEILVTACPFCEVQFKELGGIEVQDLIELLWDHRG
jgi:heterodisulfide reductase subunit D